MKKTEDISDKAIDTLVAQAEAVEASVVEEAQKNIQNRAREAKIRQLEAAITASDAQVTASVNALRATRKAEKKARESLARIVAGRETLLKTGSGIELAQAYYINAGYTPQQVKDNVPSFVRSTLGLPYVD